MHGEGAPATEIGSRNRTAPVALSHSFKTFQISPMTLLLTARMLQDNAADSATSEKGFVCIETFSRSGE